MEKEINNAIQVLHSGGTILYPTETLWGIGCDATNEKAVEKIYKIKKRDKSKSLILLVCDEEMLKKYVEEVPCVARNLIEQSVTPVTIIYDKGIHLPVTVLGEDGSVAIRITNNEFCNKLISKFGKPVVSTSANVSGEIGPRNFAEIQNKIVWQVDYIVNWKEDDRRKGNASSIIKVKRNGEIKIIRK